VEGAKAIVKWVLPTVTIGAVAVLSGKYLASWLAILVVCATIALSLLILGLISRVVDPPLDRWIARRACDWLDGRRVVWWIPQLPAVNGEVRRLYHPDEPKTPETPASPG
jgi:peptidoglycan/LPS O-acetylase OafA/YrhL